MLKMLESFIIPLCFHIPIKNLKGKSFKIIPSNPISCSCSVFPLITTILLLGFSNFVQSNKQSVDSAPLGFEISGFGSNPNRKIDGTDKGQSLVSENRVFQFGFFEKEDEFVVGIRYKLTPKSANLPVWTVGGGVRVSINSTFTLSMDGRLILFENPSDSIIWSTNTSNLNVEKLTLLNNGNLALIGSESEVIWQSFDRPTNALLPGQTLSYPQNLRAPSTRSVSSYYTLVVNVEGLALMWENNISYWKTRLSSSSVSVKEVSFNPNGVLELYDDAKNIVWSISSKDFGESSVNLRHLRIDQDGNLRIYSWDDVGHSWKVSWQAVEDQCNVFGSCGLYSVCGYNSTGPVCECLVSDSLDSSNGFRSPDSGNSGGSGCKKMVDLANCKAHTSMLVMKQTVLYGLYPPHDVDMMLNEEDCKEYCSNDTMCIAMTSKNDGSGLCTVKRTVFISGSTGPSIPSTSFLKVCLVPQAVAAKGANPNPTTKAVSFPFRGSYRKIIEAVAFVVLVTIMVILILETFIVLVVYQSRKTGSVKGSVKGAKTGPENSALVRLSYKEVHELTSGFSNQLGFFAFKGLLFEETVVVAKVLDTSLSEKEFIKSVAILGGTHHRNLASLKGFCFEPKHKVLVYECIPNGSLDKWLFTKKDKTWQNRVDIAVGVTRALAYLHTECQICIPHGNIKLENVLLDENLSPKVTDFGVKTFLQPDGACSSNETPSERDIFMLGKLLIELVLLSREAIGDSLDELIERVTKEQKYLDGEDLRGVERVVRIALWCMQNQPFLRPSVGEVMKVLEGTLSVDRPPSSFVYRNGNSNSNSNNNSDGDGAGDGAEIRVVGS